MAPPLEQAACAALSNPGLLASVRVQPLPPEESQRPGTGRLAPSPTGLLHLGHARSFLIAWWQARASQSRLLLRIEDLDQERVRPEAREQLLRDLEWLGLDWDGPAVQQSQDLAPYHAALAELAAAGQVYPCLCTRQEILHAASAPHAQERELRYPGTCAAQQPAQVEQLEARLGRRAAWRLRVPPSAVEFVDGLAGAQRFEVAREVGDFPLARRLGAPGQELHTRFAYQLAVVVDDARQGVDQIVRGADLLPSTARQILLQRALGLAQPRWWHLGLVQDEQGLRLAKRRSSTSLLELRTAGVDPRALVGWVARSVGLIQVERASARELLPLFSMRRVPSSAVRLTCAELEGLLASRL